MRKIAFIILPLTFLTLAVLVFKQTPSQIKNTLSCQASDFTGDLTTDETAMFEGVNLNIPEVALAEENAPVLGASTGERWVDVDLSEQKLRAWEGDSLFLETPISSGLPWTPTPKGEFRVWIKLRATKMEGGQGKYYYYLPNVPYVMFFQNEKVPGWKGYGLHGTYWHNSFGTRRSHGCVNLPTNIAEKLYYWLGPSIPEGKRMVIASPDNPGGRIVIHD